jgi:hypothetical protein
MIQTRERQLNTADLAGVATPATPPANGPNQPPNQTEVRRDEEVYAGALVPKDFADDLRRQWEGIQTQFVDEPKSSVQHADELVASAIKKLAETFAAERTKLEQEWSKGNDVSTEDLRVALRRYRAFFQRLISL